MREGDPDGHLARLDGLLLSESLGGLLLLAALLEELVDLLADLHLDLGGEHFQLLLGAYLLVGVVVSVLDRLLQLLLEARLLADLLDLGDGYEPARGRHAGDLYSLELGEHRVEGCDDRGQLVDVALRGVHWLA